MKNTDAVRYHTVGLLLSLLILASCAAAPDHDSGSSQESSGILHEALIDVYTGPMNHLNGVRRGVCPMHPSCSAYSRQAIARYGSAKGWIMAVDRLMRCGRDELRYAPQVMVNGELKFYDPVEANDFWGAGNGAHSAVRGR